MNSEFSAARQTSNPALFKRTIRRLFFLLIVVALLLVGWWAEDQINKPVTRVEIRSTFEHVSKAEIKKQLQPLLSVDFFALDLTAVQNALRVLPWVKDASIHRVWPSEVMISVEEQQPIARLGVDRLLSSEGAVFAPNNVAEFSALPLLEGSTQNAGHIMQQYLAISQLLRPLDLRLSQLSYSDTGSWCFQLGRISVVLGREKMAERLQRLIRLYHAQLESKWDKVLSIDLRYVNGAAVAWDKSASVKPE